ncbi:alkaline phosphatase D family protein [Bdellovibrio sp.]|uniref:alkaline phosphatase D family protein n=1 Tax=Bdellovibrio sp. TaxID=28201 RepID=UPI0039E6504C
MKPSFVVRSGMVPLLVFVVACAEKPRPESLTLKMMRMQAETTYKSDVSSVDPQDVKKVEKVVFTCCVHQSGEQSLWQQINKAQPDLVVLAGNSVDSVRFDEKPLSAQYKKLDQVEGYRDLRSRVPFMAVWDEQDYGVKNGDSEFASKNESREAFLKYWSYIPKLQTADAKGVEHSIILGPKGQRLQLILLDTRFYSAPLREENGEFKKNWRKKDSRLGKEQWKWLESELRKEADYRIIVSPVQMAANSYPGERWGLSPLERQRLFDTLREVKAHNVLFISGNRSLGAIGKVDMIDYGPLYDVTVGPFNGTAATSEKDWHYVGKQVEEPNFGMIELDWKKREAQIKILNRAGVEHGTLSLKF